MKLTYLFLRKRGYRVPEMLTDGHFPLMKALVSEGIIEGARIILENGNESRTVAAENVLIYERRDGIDSLVLEPGEVLWVRGGWKSWLPWIEKQMPSHWIMYYGANAGHGAWHHWDVVLDDTHGRSFVDDRPQYKNRLWLDYRKPVHPIFDARNQDNRPYDLCMGASHIYDRKGQYRAFEVMKLYYEKYGVKLNCVMPGSFYSHEVQTERMRRELPKWRNISFPGFLPRDQLAHIYAQTKIFIHQTDTGQGDRGPMEAGRCGCYVLVGGTHHAPYVYGNPEAGAQLTDCMNYGAIAELLHKLYTQKLDHGKIAGYFIENSGLFTAVLPRLKPLFQLFSQPKNRELLKLYEIGT